MTRCSHIKRPLVGLIFGLLLATALHAEKHENWGEPPRHNQQVPADPGASSPEFLSATGLVTQLSCVRNLEIQVKTTTETLHFHVQPGIHVKFVMRNAPPGFDPCKALKDQRVTVQYKPDDKKGKNGKIYTLRIYGPGEAEDVDAPQTRIAKPLPVPGRELEHPTVTTTAEGKVTAAHCEGNEMKITFLDHDVELTLRARDYTRLSIEQDVPFETGKFDPCSQLSGHDAKVTFVIVEDKAYDGEIQSIEVLK